MIEDAENQVENGYVQTEKPLVYTLKVTQNSQNTPEIQHPHYRGKDKKPRKTNVNSLRNLKPFQSVSDPSLLRQYARDPYKKSGLGLKFFDVLIILGLIILGISIGYLILRYYNEKREQSYDSDNLPNIFYTVKRNG